MATSTTLISLEDYLQTSYKPDCDFVDDHTEERNVGKFEHSRVQALLAAWFVGHEKLWGFIVATEQRTRVSPTRVRIPDVCLIYADAPREEITETPQLLCIEILSPDDRISRTTKVLDDFAAMGVEHLWIIDPIDRVGYIYQPGGKLQLVTDRVTVPESPIYLDLVSLFAALD